MDFTVKCDGTWEAWAVILDRQEAEGVGAATTFERLRVIACSDISLVA